MQFQKIGYDWYKSISRQIWSQLNNMQKLISRPRFMCTISGQCQVWRCLLRLPLLQKGWNCKLLLNYNWFPPKLLIVYLFLVLFRISSFWSHGSWNNCLCFNRFWLCDDIRFVRRQWSNLLPPIHCFSMNKLLFQLLNLLFKLFILNLKYSEGITKLAGK